MKRTTEVPGAWDAEAASHTAPHVSGLLDSAFPPLWGFFGTFVGLAAPGFRVDFQPTH